MRTLNDRGDSDRAVHSRTGFRPWTMDDIPELARLADDPQVAAILRDGFPVPYTVQDAEQFIRSSMGDGPSMNYAITFDGRTAGGIGVVPGQDVHRISGEIGYWLGREYWGRGIATQAVIMFSEFIFATTPLLHLHAGLFSTNPASSRVLLKAGYRYIGRMTDCAVKNGRVISLDLYELCADQRKNAAMS